MENEFEQELKKLKAARDNLLSFHKVLIDREKRELERTSGTVTPGQFLGLLMGDENFEWLRTISRLVVRIDEAFDLSDGISSELVVQFRTEIESMFDESGEHAVFKENVEKRTETLPQAEALRSDLRNAFD